MPRVTIDDINLMPAFRRGEQDAYNAVFHHFVRSLHFFTNQIVHDVYAAEDIVADTFIRTFRINTEFDSLNKLKSYLYRTASNGALDFIRTKKRHNHSHEEIRYLTDHETD